MRELMWQEALGDEAARGLRAAGSSLIDTVLPEVRDILSRMQPGAGVPDSVRREMAALAARLRQAQQRIDAMQAAWQKANDIMRAAEDEAARVCGAPLAEQASAGAILPASADIPLLSASGDLSRLSGVVLPAWLSSWFSQ
jgi:uncharacterized protein (DUF1501 family)